MLDFNPNVGKIGKTITVTIDDITRDFLRVMCTEHCINVSKFVRTVLNNLAKMGRKQAVQFVTNGHKYRYMYVPVRAEVAEYLEKWALCGNVVAGAINNTTIRNSTPLEIAEKLSRVIADDAGIQTCDSTIYGSTEAHERVITRCAEKAQELPSNADL